MFFVQKIGHNQKNEVTWWESCPNRRWSLLVKRQSPCNLHHGNGCLSWANMYDKHIGENRMWAIWSVTTLFFANKKHWNFLKIHYSWWLNQPIWKNMLVKLGSSSPIFGGEHKTYLSCHHPVCFFIPSFLLCVVFDQNKKNVSKRPAPKVIALRSNQPTSWCKTRSKYSMRNFFACLKKGGRGKKAVNLQGTIPWDPPGGIGLHHRLKYKYL